TSISADSRAIYGTRIEVRGFLELFLRARPYKQRMKTWQLGWAVIVMPITLLLALVAESSEAQCRADNGFLCFNHGVALGLVLGIGVIVWLVGAALIWLVAAFSGKD